jgi:hypothetical protein
MKTIITIIVFCCVSIIAAAHNGSTRGHIYTEGNNRPLEGATVQIKSLNISAVSDVFGAFLLREIPEGSYTVTITHLGFEAKEETIKIEDGITTDLNVYVHTNAVSLQDVTVNATKDAPYTSVSGIDLKTRPVNSSQDLLRLVPGLFIGQHAGGGKAEQMFLRGFDVDHGTDVRVTVDGMPVNMVSHAHGQGYADLHWLMPELVEKISFGKGPYELSQGNFATAGWVGFKTVDYLEHSFIKAEVGTYDWYRLAGAVDLLKGTKSHNNAYIAGEYVYNKGFFDASQDFNRFNLSAKYTANLGDNKILRVNATGFKSKWYASGQVPQRAVDAGLIGRFGAIDPKEGGNTSRYNFNISYDQAINSNTSFKSNLYAGYYDFELYSNFTFFLEDSVNGDEIKQKESRILAGYNGAFQNTHSIGHLNARLEAGLGFRYDSTDNTELSHTMQRKTLINRIMLGDINETNLFAYAGETVFFTPKFAAHAGLRYDYFSHSYEDKLPVDAATTTNTNGAFQPKGGLWYDFARNSRVYFNYGVGFHSNDTRTVIDPAAVKEVLPLAYSYDLGVTTKPAQNLLLSAAVWMLDLQQEFVYVGDGGIVEPSGQTRRMGIDLNARYEITKWLYADADFNYTHARAVADGVVKGEDYIPLAARITSQGGLTYKSKKSFTASLRYRHMGDRAAREDNSLIAPGYTVFDATANYRYRRFDFGLQIQNLFNTDWNETQFDTESRLRNEAASVSEIHFTPGTPFFIKGTVGFRI